MEEVIYWECHYINCEGNPTWSHAKAPLDWTEYDVGEGLMNMGGSCGDDPAEFLYATETDDSAESSMYYDFT